MLADHPIQPVLQATDLGAVSAFYHDLLGLPILGQSDRHLVFGCGGGTQLAVSTSTTGAADTRTQATWLVDDVRAAVAWLRSRGVTVTAPPGGEDPGRHRRRRVCLGCGSSIRQATPRGSRS